MLLDVILISFLLFTVSDSGTVRRNPFYVNVVGFFGFLPATVALAKALSFLLRRCGILSCLVTLAQPNVHHCARFRTLYCAQLSSLSLSSVDRRCSTRKDIYSLFKWTVTNCWALQKLLKGRKFIACRRQEAEKNDEVNIKGITSYCTWIGYSKQ